MNSRKERIRSRFQVESLEGRVVLSSGVNGLVAGSHLAGDRAAAIQVQRHGQDDPANHDANDNRHGADDPANHDANDDRGGQVQRAARRRGGADDPANHDANDDRGGVLQLPGRRRRGGADDPVNHNRRGHRGVHR